MKNIDKLLGVILAVAFLSVGFASCTDFADTPGKSVWSEGLWIIPTVTALGAAWFWYVSIKAHQSGSYKIIEGRLTKEDGGKMPIWEIGQFWFAVGLTIATIFVIWNVVSNR